MIERSTREPTVEDIRELVAFLPKLCAEGFEPIIGYIGGVNNKNGIYVFPQRMCHELVSEFVDVIHKQDCWNDYKYLCTLEQMKNSGKSDIATASLEEMKAWITKFVRGEQFCDGYWAGMIENGKVCLMLERLSEIERELKYPSFQFL